jgi:dihydroneopterin aldolase
MSNSESQHDGILLESMSFYAYHGVNPEERSLGQRFMVDLRVELDLSAAGKSDSLSDTISYTELYKEAKAVLEGEAYNLLEAVAEAVAQRVLAFFPVSAVWVRVTKPSPPIKGATLTGAAVEVYRKRKA